MVLLALFSALVMVAKIALRTPIGYVLFGALTGLLGALTLAALRRAGFFAYLAEKR